MVPSPLNDLNPCDLPATLNSFEQDISRSVRYELGNCPSYFEAQSDSCHLKSNRSRGRPLIQIWYRTDRSISVSTPLTSTCGMEAYFIIT
jgi:hypothetical protein